MGWDGRSEFLEREDSDWLRGGRSLAPATWPRLRAAGACHDVWWILGAMKTSIYFSVVVSLCHLQIFITIS